MRILVVDGSPAVVEEIRAILECAGHAVQTLDNPVTFSPALIPAVCRSWRPEMLILSEKLPALGASHVVQIMKNYSLAGFLRMTVILTASDASEAASLVADYGLAGYCPREQPENLVKWADYVAATGGIRGKRVPPYAQQDRTPPDDEDAGA